MFIVDRPGGSLRGSDVSAPDAEEQIGSYCWPREEHT